MATAVWGFPRNLLVRLNSSGSEHSTKAEREPTDSDDPGVCHHQPVDKPALHHLSRRQGNNTDTQSRVHERLVEVAPLERWHPAIFAGLTVKDGVDGDNRTAKDGTAYKQLA